MYVLLLMIKLGNNKVKVDPRPHLLVIMPAYFFSGDAKDSLAIFPDKSYLEFLLWRATAEAVYCENKNTNQRKSEVRLATKCLVTYFQAINHNKNFVSVFPPRKTKSNINKM